MHRNPTPGPAAQAWVYGHVWVTLARVVAAPAVGGHRPAGPGRPVRPPEGLGTIPPEYRWPFRTKLELAAELIGWLAVWLGTTRQRVLAGDGRGVRQAGGAAGGQAAGCSWSAGCGTTRPCGRCPIRNRGRASGAASRCTGTSRISLAKRAAARGGWVTAEFDVYGRYEAKTYKTFLATWPPATTLLAHSL